MALTKNELIEKALRESKDFSKEIRRYLHETEKQRPLTKQESKLYESTHEIHVHTNDAILLFEDILKKNTWIPISSGNLPEERVSVQVTYIGYNDGKRYCDDYAYIEERKWFWVEDDEDVRVKVIAWCPAREPYEGEKNEAVER